MDVPLLSRLIRILESLRGGAETTTEGRGRRLRVEPRPQ